MSILLRLWRAAPKTTATAAVSGTAASAWVATGDDPRQRAYSLWACPVRLGRCASAGVVILADYKWSLRGLDGAALQAEMQNCHLRSAARMVRVAGSNGGVYIKAGQHLGQMDHLLPVEYVRTFRDSLLDKCPVSPPQEVRRIFVNDFGAAPEATFASFDPVPVASASLAQVHRAVGHDGQQLAVKVQHAGLRESGAADTATIGLAVELLRYFAPDYDYRWVVDETRTSLPLELDFEHEAGNMARCAANLSSPDCRVAGDVAVPQAVPGLTSKRVLTMQYMDGVGVNNLQGLVDMGADPAEVSRLISETFAEMIFRFGDVHCDPHAANMKIRVHPGTASAQPARQAAQPQAAQGQPGRQSEQSGLAAAGTAVGAGNAISSDSHSSPSGSGSSRVSPSDGSGSDGEHSSLSQSSGWRARWLRPWRRQQQKRQRLQLVLLDHGLYRQLDDDFRLQYARMWQALVMADEAAIRAAAAGMGAGDTTELFAGVLTQRPWSQVVEGSADHLRVGRGGEAERQQLNEYAQQFAADAAKLLQRVPRALLLLLKTNDCLRSVDASLGQPVNTFLITARACDRALAAARWDSHPGVGTLVHNLTDTLRLEWRLALFRAAAALGGLQAALQQHFRQGLAAIGLAAA